MTVIDNGQLSSETPAGTDQGPFFVWRRRSDSYVGVSRVRMDEERFELLLTTEDWRTARAWVLVERYAFPVDEAVSYLVVLTQWEADSAHAPTGKHRSQMDGALVKSELREMFRFGPYDSATVNSLGEISLLGVKKREEEADLMTMVVFSPPSRG